MNWYPGHMARAEKEMRQSLSSVDLILEVRDARIPCSSGNPQLQERIGGKPRAILLNKEDLADPSITKKWVEHFRSLGVPCAAFNAVNGAGRQQLRALIRQLTQEKRERDRRKGITGKLPVRAMVAGIPNTGKSTLINCLAGRKIAASQDRPGVTRSVRWIQTAEGMALLDTPGVLPPKIQDEQTGLRLAVTGAVREEILRTSDIVSFALTYLAEQYPSLLEKRYGIDPDPDWRASLSAICQSRAYLLPEGKEDLERTGKMVLKEIREGILGRISWEEP